MEYGIVGVTIWVKLCVPVYMYLLFCQISLQTESSMVVAVIFLKSSGSVWKSWASWGAFCVVSAEFWKQIVFYYSDICGSLIAHYMPCLMYVLHVLHARSKSQQHTVLGSHCVFQSQEVGKKLQAFQRSSRRTYATEFLWLQWCTLCNFRTEVLLDLKGEEERGPSICGQLHESSKALQDSNFVVTGMIIYY